MAFVDFTANGAGEVKSSFEVPSELICFANANREGLAASRHSLRRRPGRRPILKYAITIGNALPLALLFDSYLWISDSWESKLLENRTERGPLPGLA